MSLGGTSSGGGTRTPDTRIMIPLASRENTEKYAPSDERAAPGAAVEPAEVPIDLDLQLVIEAWKTLPEATKAGIMAMVQAAK